MRKFGLAPPPTPRTPGKPKVGLRTTRPDELWHIDTTVIRLLDGTSAYVHAVIDNFSRRILAWRVADAFERDIERAEAAGADAVSVKPVLPDRLAEEIRRVILTRAHQRRETVEPPLAPPAPVCPACDHELKYLKSFVGGVSAKHPEQWDYFACPRCRATFQYRQSTRKLRRVVSSAARGGGHVGRLDHRDGLEN